MASTVADSVVRSGPRMMRRREKDVDALLPHRLHERRTRSERQHAAVLRDEAEVHAGVPGDAREEQMVARAQRRDRARVAAVGDGVVQAAHQRSDRLREAERRLMVAVIGRCAERDRPGIAQAPVPVETVGGRRVDGDVERSGQEAVVVVDQVLFDAQRRPDAVDVAQVKCGQSVRARSTIRRADRSPPAPGPSRRTRCRPRTCRDTSGPAARPSRWGTRPAENARWCARRSPRAARECTRAGRARPEK